MTKIKPGSTRSRTMGRCHSCGRCFLWKYTTTFKVRDGAACPLCGGRMRQTTVRARKGVRWLSIDGTRHPELTAWLVKLSPAREAKLVPVFQKRRAKLLERLKKGEG